MKQPEYMRVYQDLVDQIRNSTYPIGTLLPPEPELEKIYGVSRTTIRRAVGLLASARQVSIRQGRGTEVLSRDDNAAAANTIRFHNISGFAERILPQQGPRSMAPLNVDVIPAPSQALDPLQLLPGDEVYRVQRREEMEDGSPFSYRVNYLPKKAYPGFLKYDRVSISLYNLLGNDYDVWFDHGEESISAVSADFLTAQVLGVKLGDPLLLFRRKAYSASGPMEYAEMYIRPDHYELVLYMQGSPYPATPEK